MQIQDQRITYAVIPALPGEPREQILLDAGQSSFGMSRLGTFNFCPEKYDNDYGEDPVPEDERPETAFWFIRGSAMHTAFAHYHLRSMGKKEYLTPHNAWNLWMVKNHADHSKAQVVVDAVGKLWPLVEDFMIFHMSDWEAISVEEEFEYVTPGGCRVTCRLDVIMRRKSTGEVCIVDLKTSTKNHNGTVFIVQNSRQFALFEKMKPQLAEQFGVDAGDMTLAVITAQFLKRKEATPQFEYVTANQTVVEALDDYIDATVAAIGEMGPNGPLTPTPILDTYQCFSDIPGGNCAHTSRCFGFKGNKE